MAREVFITFLEAAKKKFFVNSTNRLPCNATNILIEFGDVILGHQFNERLESFAPCYSKSLQQGDLKENRSILWF
jgi:hypothetical protein